MLYDENKKPVWSSGTRGNYDEIELVVQDDNNVVLYNSFSRDRPVLWSTYTKDRYCPEDEIGKSKSSIYLIVIFIYRLVMSFDLEVHYFLKTVDQRYSYRS